MKTTLLSQDGNTQLVLTPETKFEKDILDKYAKDFDSVKLFKGSFEDCVGGWTKLFPYDTSIILRIKEEKMMKE